MLDFFFKIKYFYNKLKNESRLYHKYKQKEPKWETYVLTVFIIVVVFIFVCFFNPNIFLMYISPLYLKSPFYFKGGGLLFFVILFYLILKIIWRKFQVIRQYYKERINTSKNNPKQVKFFLNFYIFLKFFTPILETCLIIVLGWYGYFFVVGG